MNTTAIPRRQRIQPLRALRSIRALLRNPDDTPRVFEIIDALSGNSGERSFQRFRRTPTGARILAERRNLLATLSDRARLSALPDGSFGRTYAEFAAREQITADGLLAASMQGGRRRDVGPERRLFGDRMRDMHDLWHIVSGYGRDLVGEASLLAFTFAQTRNPGIGFIVAVAWLKAGRTHDARRLMTEAWKRGRHAQWLPAQDWEALLDVPLTQVREQLRLGTPPVYTPLRSSGAPVLA